MSHNEAYYRQLLNDYINNKCTPQQVEEVFDFLRQDLSGKMMLQQLQDEFNRAMQEQIPISTAQTEAMRRRLVQSIEQKKVIPFYQKPFFRVAAAVVIIIITGTYFLFNNYSRQLPRATALRTDSVKHDIKPGGDKAMLTLADGSTIVLDSAQNGSLTNQGNAKVVKLSNGLLAYHNSGNTTPNEIVYNTLTTPKGGRYQISLVDGTRVWLNAASSITFPTEFSGKERKVEITGEVYFEVAPSTSLRTTSLRTAQKIPFIVKKSKSDVEIKVLGTHFNVNAYDDESSVQITLLEGAVDIGYGNAHSLLKPGEQAKLSDKNIRIAKDADLNEVMAWKNGWFYFEDADIKKIMRQVEKWYDVEVKYDADIKSVFSAEISRDVNVSKLLKILELTGLVHFKIENNMIIITK